MDIINAAPSKELKIKVSFDGTQFIVEQSYDGAQAGEELKIHVHADMLVDALAEKIVAKNAKLAWVSGVVPFVKSVMKMLA
jgi:hypothetical protein